MSDNVTVCEVQINSEVVVILQTTFKKKKKCNKAGNRDPEAT